MATFQKFHPFVLALASGVHDLSSDQMKIALVSAANMPSGIEGQLVDLSEISYTYASSRNVTLSSIGQTLGVMKVVIDDMNITATGGAVGPFQGVILYNDTATNDELIGFWDLGAEVTLSDAESTVLDFNNIDGVIQLA